MCYLRLEVHISALLTLLLMSLRDLQNWILNKTLFWFFYSIYVEESYDHS